MSQTRSPARLLFAATCVLALVPGCGDPEAPPEPEAKVRLQKLLRLYIAYADRNRQGPPDAQALTAFGHKLTAQERDELMIGDDLESIFISPRDQQPFAVRYKVRPDPGQPRAIAWEAAGKDGLRWVALSTGYVEEYDDDTFKEYQQ